MAFLRKRGEKYSLSFKWKNKSYIKALGTTSEGDAKRINEPGAADVGILEEIGAAGDVEVDVDAIRRCD